MEDVLARKCHETRLTALMNEAYYRHRAQSHARIDLGLRWFAGAMGAGAVGAALRGVGDVYGVPVMQTLVALAAVASVAGPVLRFAESAKHWADLAARWSGIVGEFDRMAIQPMTDEEKQAFCLDLILRSNDLQQQDTAPRKDRLVLRIQKRVCRQEGLVLS